jgi:hypothetical protein
MISADQAALRAALILAYPADDPEDGWELHEFPQGWLVHWRGWMGPPGGFTILIERANGLVRYFTGDIPAEAIISDYAAVHELGHPDYRFAVPPARTVRPLAGRTATRQHPPARNARRPGSARPRR